MKVKLAKTAGFCMGVRRAMEMVLAEANKKEGPLYTFGPLIHNKQVLQLLESKGVHSLEDLKDLPPGRIVIRAHGIPPEERKALRETGLRLIDATCPRVARVQAIIRYHTKKGYTAVIVGDQNHAEVKGLVGYSAGPVHVTQREEEVEALPPMDRVLVVAQTTQNAQAFDHIVDAVRRRFQNVEVFNTICDATHQRQKEVRAFQGQVEAVVVVGGYHSANTQRLAQISREVGLPTFHVETEKDLNREALSQMASVGVTAGASTPNWMIKNVIQELEGIRSSKDSSIFRGIRQAFKFLILSNLLVAGGAFSFAYAASILLFRHNPDLTFPCVTFLYIFAMHVLNRFLDKGASAYNDPERAAFLGKFKVPLILSALVAILTALALAYTKGPATFLALTGFSLLGIIYSIPLIPKRIRHKSRYAKIKDVPGSRSLSESLAWVALIGVLPLLDMKQVSPPTALITILAVFLIAYIRSVLFDIFQVQGDLIVGTETLPITLGEKKALVLLKVLLTLTALILGVSPLLGLVPSFSGAIIASVFGLSLCLFAYERHWLQQGLTLEALVEGNFFLAGFLALVR